MQKLIFNADTTLLAVTDPDGIRLAADAMRAVYADNILLVGHFTETIDSTTTDLDLSTAASLRVTIRRYRRHQSGTDNPILTYQYTYNDGQYPAGEVLAEGKATWLVTIAGTALLAALDAATDDELEVWVEISATLGAAADPQTLAQFQITVVPQLDDGTAGTPPPSSPTYLTAAENAALLAASLSDSTPAALGTAAAGSGTKSSRDDHVHDMPSAADVGADATGTAAGLIAAQKGAADGLAPLGSDSKIASSYLPLIALTSVSVVATEAAQLALTAEEGDVAVRSDEAKSYAHNGGSAGDMTDWTLLQTPSDVVLSVAGETGVISKTDLLTALNVADGAEANPAAASQAEMEAGTETANRSMSPLRVAQAFVALDCDRVYTPAGTTVAGYVYRRTATAWELADPDTAACETQELWMALGTDPETDGMVANAIVTTGTWTGVPGSPIWLADDGAMTETVPSAATHAGRVARIVGFVRSASTMRVDGHVMGATYEAASS